MLKHREKAGFPFWARLWPSAIALATFIQKSPHWVVGKQVAELAAGIGLPSLVAAKYAQQVWCSDLVPEAMDIAAKSAEHHGLRNISFHACDWNHLPEVLMPEVLLLSDVNYDPAVFGSLWVLLEGFLQKGATILLATPQRLMAKPFLESLSGYITDSYEEYIEENSQKTFISIFVLSYLSDYKQTSFSLI